MMQCTWADGWSLWLWWNRIAPHNIHDHNSQPVYTRTPGILWWCKISLYSSCNEVHKYMIVLIYHLIDINTLHTYVIYIFIYTINPKASSGNGLFFNLLKFFLVYFMEKQSCPEGLLLIFLNIFKQNALNIIRNLNMMGKCQPKT